MFTGIVEEVGRVLSRRGGRLTIGADWVLRSTRVGDSIAVNGACLTVVSKAPGRFSVEVTPETLRRTNLGDLRAGDPVDLERPLRYGGRAGGHLVQGHVDATGRVLSITPEGNSHIFRFEAPSHLMRYMVEKGFIAVDGISLTVVACGGKAFTVVVVPYTYENTVLGHRKPGERVNLEVDPLAKYVERLVKAQEG